MNTARFSQLASVNFSGAAIASQTGNTSYLVVKSDGGEFPALFIEFSNNGGYNRLYAGALLPTPQSEPKISVYKTKSWVLQAKLGNAGFSPVTTIKLPEEIVAAAGENLEPHTFFSASYKPGAPQSARVAHPAEGFIKGVAALISVVAKPENRPEMQGDVAKFLNAAAGIEANFGLVDTKQPVSRSRAG